MDSTMISPNDVVVPSLPPPPYSLVASEPTLAEFTVSQLSELEKVYYDKLYRGREECEASGKVYPVDFEGLYPIVGYGQKVHAKRALIERSRLVESIDFIIRSSPSENNEAEGFLPIGRKPLGGRPSEKIFLTWQAAQIFVIQAPTAVGDEVRRFFVHILELHQDYVKIQAQHHITRAVADARHEEILAAHGDGQGVYLGSIGFQSTTEKPGELYKYGFASKLKERVRAHVGAFPLFRLVHFQRTLQPADVERAFKTHPTVRNHHMTIVDKFGKNQTEILCLNKDFTRDDAVELLVRKTKELSATVVDACLLEIERERTEQERCKVEQERCKVEQLRLQLEVAHLGRVPETNPRCQVASYDAQKDHVIVEKSFESPTRAQKHSSQNESVTLFFGSATRPRRAHDPAGTPTAVLFEAYKTWLRVNAPDVVPMVQSWTQTKFTQSMPEQYTSETLRFAVDGSKDVKKVRGVRILLKTQDEMDDDEE
ncbi:hypothetical protein HDU93_009191 [Gonapodya sp. JEL0774]|nr:hypothetical protein HDU93_009191 [Gonapodya sp. JEL0774]